MQKPLIDAITLLKESWGTFLKTWDKTVRISAWYIAISIISAITVFFDTEKGGMQFIGFLLNAISAIATVYLFVRLYQWIFSIEDEKETPDKKGETWTIVAQLLVVSLFMSIPMIAVIGIALTSTAQILIVLICMAILFYVYIRLTFVQQRIIDQANGPLEAIKYSFYLTKNRFWALFFRMCLGGLAFGVLFTTLNLCAIVLVSFISGVDLATEMNNETVPPAVESMAIMIQSIVLSSILPFLAIFTVKLFRSTEQSTDPKST